MKLSSKKIKLDVKGKKQMKHKNYDVIVAWANGEKIEYNHPKNGWIEVHGATPNFGGTVQLGLRNHHKILLLLPMLCLIKRPMANT